MKLKVIKITVELDLTLIIHAHRSPVTVCLFKLLDRETEREIKLPYTQFCKKFRKFLPSAPRRDPTV